MARRITPRKTANIPKRPKITPTVSYLYIQRDDEEPPVPPEPPENRAQMVFNIETDEFIYNTFTDELVMSLDF